MNINAKITTEIEQNQTNYFFYALILYSVGVLYLLPYDFQLSHAKICLPLLALILFVQSFGNQSKLLVTDIVIVCLILIVSVINFSPYHLFRYSLPICLMAIGFSGFKSIPIKRLFLVVLCWISFFAMVLQMAIYRRQEFDGSGRITLSVGDPNISGLYMLLFFFLCYKIRFKPGIILGLVSSLLFLSRNYFLTLAIFFVIVFFEKKITKIAVKFNFIFIFFVANVLGILIGEYFLQHVEIGLTYDTSSSRLFSLNDKSNLLRFEANRFLLSSYINNLNLALRGYGAEYENVFRPIGAIIHNSFLEVIAYTGIPLGILYFCVVLRVFQGYYVRDNCKYIFPYLFFCLFLHTGLQGLCPFFFVSILAMSVENK